MNAQPMQRKGTRILVTGGGGFLGGGIARRMVASGYRVRSFSRKYYRRLADLEIEQVTGDLADRDRLMEACDGCELVFHAAAKAGIWGDDQEFYHTNVVGTRNVIDACRAQRVSKLVYTSSPSVVFDGTDMEGIDESAPYPSRYHAAYPATKAQAEREVVGSNNGTLATVCLRPHLIWGPEDTHIVPGIIERGRRGQLRRIGKKDKLVDFTYIENAVEAHVLAAGRLYPGSAISGRCYFISDDHPVPLWDFLNRVLKAAGLPPVTRSVPFKVAYAGGYFLENLHRKLGVTREPRLTRFLVQELATAHWFDISAAKADLEYRPVVNIESGLERLKQWLAVGRQREGLPDPGHCSG